MTAGPDNSELAEALAEYQSLLDGGRRPARAAFLARFPHLAPALAGCLDMVEFVRSAAGDLTGDAGAGPPPEAPRGMLGDYRILGELGRGGMGVVYEAEQVSLRRRVALKVLPFAAVMDPRHLQRFKNEALAAAGLDHPNVVKVYGAGCERGVHFIAMQLVEGRTLAELIRERRSGPASAPPADAGDATRTLAAEAPTRTLAPDATADDPVPPPGEPRPGTASSTPADAAYARRVAEWGIQASEALEHAHALGVVHRDVKPANLMVDGRGRLYVADFGLAKIAADPGVTGTGDLLGTLRYMSPEQGAAKHDLVDHRSDIYSLGATLYELLTLAPAFGGASRADIIRRIAETDPAAPRTLDRLIPKDLETVVLKAMAKDPANRYQTAKDLAEDLGRFLEHKPVAARRPTVADRARKWGRRNRQLVTAATAVLLFTVIGLVMTTLMVSRERDVAQQERNAAQQERNTAKLNLDVAYRVLDEIYLDTMQSRLPQQNSPSPEVAKMLKKALAFYEELAKARDPEPGARRRTARAYQRVAEIRISLGHTEDAEPNLQNAMRLFEELASEFPGDVEYRRDLASCRSLRVSNFHVTPGKGGEALRLARQNVAAWEALATEYPGDPKHRSMRVYAHHQLGFQLSYKAGSEDYAEAEKAFRRALALQLQLPEEEADALPNRTQLGHIYANLGFILMKAKKTGEAETFVRGAFVIRKRLADEAPRDAGHRDNLAFGYENLAWILEEKECHEEALENHRQALALREQLVAELPGGVEIRGLAMRSLSFVATGWARIGRYDEAARQQRQLVAIQQKMVSDFPERFYTLWGYSRVNARSLRRDILFRLAEYLALASQPQEAEPPFRQALDIAVTLAADFPQDGGNFDAAAWHLANSPAPGLRDPTRAVDLATKAMALKPDLGPYWKTLAVARYRAGEWRSAVAALEKSMALRGGGDAFDWYFLAMAHRGLGDEATAREWYDKAESWTAKTMPKDRELQRLRAEAAERLGVVAPPPRSVR